MYFFPIDPKDAITGIKFFATWLFSILTTIVIMEIKFRKAKRKILLESSLQRQQELERECWKIRMELLTFQNKVATNAYRDILLYVQLLRDKLRPLLTPDVQQLSKLGSSGNLKLVLEIQRIYASNQIAFKEEHRGVIHALKNKCSEIVNWSSDNPQAGTRRDIHSSYCELLTLWEEICNMQDYVRKLCYDLQCEFKTILAYEDRTFTRILQDTR